MGRKGKEFPYRVKKEAIERAGNKCERCGSTERLQVHHRLAIWFASEFFPQIANHVLTSIRNAEVLCAECHDKHHYKDRGGRNNRRYFKAAESLGIKYE